jgi:hypothetical protein
MLAAALAVAAVAPAADGRGKHLGGLVGGPRGVFAGGSFTEPSDVAVYRGGAGGGRKLFVVEASRWSSRVQRLDGHGNFELAWGRDAVRPGVAGDRGRGYEVCRAQVSGAAGCHAAPPGGRAGELRMPTAVAVSETTGDVYVMDRGNRRVQRFDLDGRFIAAWGWGVATGRPRFEVCTAGCRPARSADREGGADAGRFASARMGAIAVSPRPPNHVLVGDEGNDRVVELTAAGQLLRVWGWGVATGARRFEVCEATDGCRAGHRRRGGAWPRHLAADAAGIVYGSQAALDAEVVRFASHPSPSTPDASGALLAPLASPGLINPGSTIGIAVDAVTGDLAVARDPFGPMVVSEVSDPGGPRPEAILQEGLPYLGSVNGIAADEGVVYVAKSTRLNPNDPVTALGDCDPGGRERPCNGLVLLAPGGTLSATLTSAARHGTERLVLAGAIAAHGAVRYRFQISRDGRSWGDLAPPRMLIGDGFRRVSVVADGLRPATAYQARLVGVRADGDRTVATSSRLPLVMPAPH